MRGIVSIGDVVEMNKVLQDQGIPAYVHLHDTCGSQFFTFGPPKGSETQGVSEPSSPRTAVVLDGLTLIRGRRVGGSLLGEKKI